MRTQAEQIAQIRADQAFWRAIAAEVGPARYAEPGPMGEWSFGDMAGHLAGWRERTINRVLAVAHGEPEPTPPWGAELDGEDDVDKVNDWIREQHAGRSPEQLVAEYDASYDRLIEALEAVPAHLQTAVAAWAEMPLVEVDFTGHLHEACLASELTLHPHGKSGTLVPLVSSLPMSNPTWHVRAPSKTQSWRSFWDDAARCGASDWAQHLLVAASSIGNTTNLTYAGAISALRSSISGPDDNRPTRRDELVLLQTVANDQFEVRPASDNTQRRVTVPDTGSDDHRVAAFILSGALRLQT